MKISAITAAVLSLLLTACSSELTAANDSEPPYNPVDEAWKVLENYQYAYNNRDLALLDTTLDSEFLHHLLETDWDDYNGDGVIDSTWDGELELSFAQALFSSCESIELTLTGTEQYTWPDDPTGESIAFPRLRTTTVWYVFPDSGYIENLTQTLICRPDSTGTWYLTHLIETEQDI